MDKLAPYLIDNERELLAQVADGSEVAFGQLYQHYFVQLYPMINIVVTHAYLQWMKEIKRVNSEKYIIDDNYTGTTIVKRI